MTKDMTQGVRVYVNEAGVSVAVGATALDAVREYSATDADDIANGISQLLDSRGLPIAAATSVHGGAIYRIVPVRKRAPNVDATGTAR